MTFCLRVFGTVALEGPLGPVSGGAAQQRSLAVLALLASAHPHGCTRDKLVGYLWPDSDQERARHRIADVLHVIRKSLGEDAIVSVGELVRLNRAVVDSDVALFVTAREAGDLETAVRAYSGPFLDGFALNGAAEFQRWAEDQRQRLGDAYAEALHSLMAQAQASGDQVAAVRWWKRLLAYDPYNSRYALGLIEALALSGDPANAWLVLDEHERRLREELEVDPPADLHRRAKELIARETDRPLDARKPVQADAQSLEDSAQLGKIGSAPTASTDGPSRRQTSTGRRRTAWWVGGVALVAAVGALITWYTATGRQESGRPLATAYTRVAVFPFTVPSVSEFADLGEGLMELLGAAIDGAGEVRQLDPVAVLSRLRRSELTPPLDIDTARQIATEMGADHFVLGRLVNLRGAIRLFTSLYSVASDSTFQSDHAGELGEIQTLVDALARDLLVYIDPVRGELQGSISATSTTSYTALRSYLRGLALMRRHRTGPAWREFKSAVDEDSMFALAWLGLAEAGSWTSPATPAENRAHWERAHNLSGRLSPRSQAYLATGYAWARGDGPSAERAARAMVAAYPDAVEGWRYLGEVLRWYAWQLGRNTAPEAEYWFRRVLTVDPDNQLVVNALALIAYHEGHKQRGDSLWHGMGRYWVPPEDSLERTRYFARLENFRFGGLVNRAWAIPFATDSLTDAARVTRLLTNPSRPDSERAVGHQLAAFGAVAGARWQTADRHFAQANQLEPGRGVLERAWYSTFPLFQVDSARLRGIRDSLAAWTPAAGLGTQQGSYWRNWQLPSSSLSQARLYVLGLLSARLLEVNAAARYADSLVGLEESADPIALLHDLALEVRALSAVQSGDWEAALTLLEDAELKNRQGVLEDSPLIFRPLGRVLRAEALMHLGRDEEALGWYSSLNWRGLTGPVLLAHAQLRQGEIHERLGHTAEAVHHYRRFVARWRDADPEYQPLVADVRARIARLEEWQH